MDDVLPWDAPEETPTSSAPAQREPAVSFSDGAAAHETTDGLDWLGDLGGAAPRTFDSILTHATPAAATAQGAQTGTSPYEDVETTKTSRGLLYPTAVTPATKAVAEDAAVVNETTLEAAQLHTSADDVQNAALLPTHPRHVTADVPDVSVHSSVSTPPRPSPPAAPEAENANNTGAQKAALKTPPAATPPPTPALNAKPSPVRMVTPPAETRTRQSSKASGAGRSQVSKNDRNGVVRETSQVLVQRTTSPRLSRAVRGGGTGGKKQTQSRRTTSQSGASHGQTNTSTLYTRDNFFFAGDDLGTDFGAGTTGLYAATVCPISAAAQTSTPRAYFTSAFYTKVPEGHHAQKWAKKEAAFDDWRSAQLHRSTYHTYGKSSNATKKAQKGSGTAAVTAGERDGVEVEPWLDPAAFFTDEEAQQFERRRIAAIESERRAKAKAREAQTHELETALKTKRREYQKGIPTYLPDAYYRTTLEQEAVTQLPGNHLSSSDPRADITPRDHHKAQTAYRHYQDQVAEDRVALRQREARKYHQKIESDIAQSRDELTAYQDAWLEGLPHLSRADALAKTRTTQEIQRERARLNAEESAYTRGVNTLYQEAEASQRRARLSYLRTKLPRASQDRLREVRAKSAHAEQEAAQQKQSEASTKPVSTRLDGTHDTKNARAPAPPPPAQTKAPTPSPPPAVPQTLGASPVPIALPEPRNFVTEALQWQDTFVSPNSAPLNAQDPSVRREWLRRLSSERHRFRKDTVELGKAQPARTQQAVGDLLEQRVKTAEGQRKENAGLQERRRELEAENYAYATSLYEQNKDVLVKGRAAREEIATERQLYATAQRQREKEVDAQMSALEAENLRQLREAAMGTRS